jgi:serine/threonine protein kinase
VESDEAMLEAVQKVVNKGRVYASDCRVSDVALRIPRRVPKEISRKVFVRHELIGGGAFGEVYIGDFQEHAMLPRFSVAAKTTRLDEDADHSDEHRDELRDDLLKEAALQTLLVHPNSVSVKGVITIPNDIPPFVLLEYCERGTLETFVFQGDHENELLLSLLGDTASGLEYLSSHRIVHRDIATRNVLLTQNMTAKVSDFVLARSLHEKKNDAEPSKARSSSAFFLDENQAEMTAMDHSVIGGGVVVRWASPEVLEHRKYSQASDGELNLPSFSAVLSSAIVPFFLLFCSSLRYPPLISLRSVGIWNDDTRSVFEESSV